MRITDVKSAIIGSNIVIRVTTVLHRAIDREGDECKGAIEILHASGD